MGRVPMCAADGSAVRVAGTEHVQSHHAADGENRVEWNADVDEPPLW